MAGCNGLSIRAHRIDEHIQTHTHTPNIYTISEIIRLVYYQIECVIDGFEKVKGHGWDFPNRWHILQQVAMLLQVQGSDNFEHRLIITRPHLLRQESLVTLISSMFVPN